MIIDLNKHHNEKFGKSRNIIHSKTGLWVRFNPAVHVKKQMQSHELIEVYVGQHHNEVVFVDWINCTIYLDKARRKKRIDSQPKSWILVPEDVGPVGIPHISLNRSQRIESDLMQKAHEKATSYQDDDGDCSLEIGLAEFEACLFDQLYRMRYKVPAIHTIKNLKENEGATSILNQEFYQLRNTPVYWCAKSGARFS